MQKENQKELLFLLYSCDLAVIALPPPLSFSWPAGYSLLVEGSNHRRRGLTGADGRGDARWPNLKLIMLWPKFLDISLRRTFTV